MPGGRGGGPWYARSRRQGAEPRTEGAAAGGRARGKRLIREGRSTQGRRAAGPRLRAPDPRPATRLGTGMPGPLEG